MSKGRGIREGTACAGPSALEYAAGGYRHCSLREICRRAPRGRHDRREATPGPAERALPRAKALRRHHRLLLPHADCCCSVHRGVPVLQAGMAPAAAVPEHRLSEGDQHHCRHRDMPRPDLADARDRQRQAVAPRARRRAAVKGSRPCGIPARCTAVPGAASSPDSGARDRRPERAADPQAAAPVAGHSHPQRRGRAATVDRLSPDVREPAPDANVHPGSMA